MAIDLLRPGKHPFHNLALEEAIYTLEQGYPPDSGDTFQLIKWLKELKSLRAFADATNEARKYLPKF